MGSSANKDAPDHPIPYTGNALSARQSALNSGEALKEARSGAARDEPSQLKPNTDRRLPRHVWPCGKRGEPKCKKSKTNNNDLGQAIPYAKARSKRFVP